MESFINMDPLLAFGLSVWRPVADSEAAATASAGRPGRSDCGTRVSTGPGSALGMARDRGDLRSCLGSRRRRRPEGTAEPFRYPALRRDHRPGRQAVSVEHGRVPVPPAGPRGDHPPRGRGPVTGHSTPRLAPETPRFGGGDGGKRWTFAPAAGGSTRELFAARSAPRSSMSASQIRQPFSLIELPL